MCKNTNVIFKFDTAVEMETEIKTDNKTIRKATANKSWYCHFYKNWPTLNQCITVTVTIFSNWKYYGNFVFVIILVLTSLYIVQFKNYSLGNKLKTVYTRLPYPFFFHKVGTSSNFES